MRNTLLGLEDVRPVVCFDEGPIQLIGEVRSPSRPSQARYRLLNRQPVRVPRRPSALFAVCMRELAEVHSPHLNVSVSSR
jgi:hypothetical protein